MQQRWWFYSSIALACLIGAGSGLVSAAFLESLALATRLQHENPWLLFLLPAAGALIAWMYAGIGRSTTRGNNLILDEIHTPSTPGVPLRMMPLILASTVITHLFGGSAGREGTAVQMGGALAAELSRRIRLAPERTRILLMCGISGGFSSVFGTPLAGAVFGMEMLAIGGIRYEALLPCLVAALVGDQTIRLLDVHHSHFAVTSVIPVLSTTSIAKVAIAGVAFGLASAAFSELTHWIDDTSRRLIASPIARTAVGGGVVVAVTLALGTRLYTGLSLPLLSAAFTGDGVPQFAFLAKIVLTGLTLGFGFKGGEVTPLFVIGATLGTTLSGPLGLPVDLLAALGFVAVFAAAANTPVACIVMSAELFGGHGIAYFGIAIFIAYTISGHRGIYSSQRITHGKHPMSAIPAGSITLGDLRSRPIAHRVEGQRYTQKELLYANRSRLRTRRNVDE